MIKISSVILRKCVKSKKIALTKQSSVYSVTLPQSMESLLSASEGFGDDRSASDSDAMDDDLQPPSSDEEEGQLCFFLPGPLEKKDLIKAFFLEFL